MNAGLERKVKRIINRTLGTFCFNRIIEWRQILRLLQPQNGEKILDIACGEGGLSLKMAKRNWQIHGIDISVDSIREARLLSGERGCHFLVSDAEHLPYKDCSFDKAVSSSSLEHFQDDIQALKEMSRVLKRNGIIILTTDSLSYPIEESLKERHRIQYRVVHYYNREEISKKLEQSGFRLLSSRYLLNSPLTSFIFRLFVINYGKYYRQLLVRFLGDLLVPLLLLSDRLIGKKDCGYTLLIEAEKV